MGLEVSLENPKYFSKLVVHLIERKLPKCSLVSGDVLFEKIFLDLSKLMDCHEASQNY